ncbi:SH3 domain-containing protein [candidate division WOR-3 bacterium]|nr:SH3 domain-containing protein [candidate division WOR-3 bacterium]
MLLNIIFALFVAGNSIHYSQFLLYRDSLDYTEIGRVYVPLEQAPAEGLRNDFYGYLPSWVSNTTYQEFDFRLLTHLAYFSVELNTSGGLGSIPNQSRFNEIVSLCHPRGVRVHMTVTLFGSSSVAAFLNSSSARQTAITNITNLVTSSSIEGVNIDFEFVTSSVRDSFTLFIQGLAQSLQNSPQGRKELYIAMPCVPSWYPGYNFSALADASDGLFIMAYDYHYSGSSVAGPVAPTYNSSFWGYYAVNTSIGDIINSYGTAREKVVLGMPYYGIDWPTTSQNAGSSTTGSGSAVTFKNAKANASAHGRIWDSNSATPWYRYNSGSWHQCWYDDSVSIMLKLELARDSLLQGAGCWALGYDSGEDDLWNVLRHVFRVDAPFEHYSALVSAPNLNVRSGPSVSYPVISQIIQGQKFSVFDQEDNWYKIYFPSGSGFAHAWADGGDGHSTGNLQGANGGDLLQITASLLNVRSGPTTDSSVLTLVSTGQCFVPDSYSGNWARISLADSNQQGWIHYVNYSVVINCPEDSNVFGLSVDSFAIPDTVVSGDTFAFVFYLYNQGKAPFDSLVCMSLDSASPFFHNEFWTDSLNARTYGFDALPKQYCQRNSYGIAPAVSSPQTFSQTFRFCRKNYQLSQDTAFSITVIPSQSGIEKIIDAPFQANTVAPACFLFRETCVFISDFQGIYELTVRDVIGRVRFCYTGDGEKIIFGEDQPPGAYFYEVKFPDNANQRFLTGKIIKTE